MSGFLAQLSTGPAGGLVSALQAILQTASFRGVIFEVFDASDGGARRWAQFLFPGRSDKSQEDMGGFDGPLTVSAVLIGDDYVSRARRLKAACQAAGPAMLRHPWLGQVKVTCTGAQFGWDHQKLRLCTVQLTFELWSPAKPPDPNSLTGMLDAIGQTMDDVQSMLADALAPLGTALGLLSMAQSAVSTISGVVDGVIGGAPNAASAAALAGLSGGTPSSVPGGVAAIAAAAAPALANMTGGITLAPGATIGTQVATLTAAALQSIASAGSAQPSPSIGPGPAATPPPPTDPRAAAAILLAAVPMLAPGMTSAGAVAGAVPDPVAAMLLAAQVQAALQAVVAASAIPWTSSNEALSWRGHVDGVLTSVQQGLAGKTLAGVPALRTGPVWLDLRLVRSTWSTDVQQVAGRLPSVRYITTTLPMSAWTIAQAVAGDTPNAVRATMLDLVARNGVRHPGRVPAGVIEVLVRTA